MPANLGPALGPSRNEASLARWAGAVLVLVLAVAPAGCGQQSSSQRTQVARYISEIKSEEATLTPALMAVTQVSAQVAANGGRILLGKTPLLTQERRLNGALIQIQAQEARLRGLSYPAAAAHLRSLVLAMSSDQATLTHQLALLVAFLPRFNSAVSPLQGALARLERVLSQRQARGSAAVFALYAAKAQALRSFQGTTRQIADHLRPLIPPPVSRPAYEAQLTSLRGMGASAGSLARALAAGSPGDVRPLLIQFDRAALATHSRSVQQQQIAAIRAYDAQSERLTTLSEAISRERLRLSNTLR